MGRKPRWVHDSYQDGVDTHTLSSWKYFHDFIQENELLDRKTYIFRGQRNEGWLIEPSINRTLSKGMADFIYQERLENHLDTFKFSIRGRTANLKEIINDENELWTLGQHYGLKTPMLDFTISPYVAAYFAFINEENETDFRVIWGASKYTTENQVDKELEIYRPLSDHTPRLINQNGLFIKFNVNEDLESIVKKTDQDFKGEIQLHKIRIPNKDRIMCLRFLNTMNINHNTLFPDSYGASIYTNLHLEIDKY